MNHQQPPFQNREKKAKQQQFSTEVNRPEDDRYSYPDVSDYQSEEPPVVKEKSHKTKHRFFIGLFALLTFIASMMFDEPTSIEGQQSIQSTGVVNGVTAGTVLFDSDEGLDLEPRDYEITMEKGTESSRMLIWDFAAEDGDIVKVRVDGTTVNPQVHLRNQPTIIEVPVPSTVEIVGVKDGAGGITYGVKFPGNISNRAYFNVAPEGSSNTYTILGP